MNERIKELALQAGYEADMFGLGHWDMPECRKFAELIIKQCCDAADDWYENQYMIHCDPAQHIRDNFGVEE